MELAAGSDQDEVRRAIEVIEVALAGDTHVRPSGSSPLAGALRRLLAKHEADCVAAFKTQIDIALALETTGLSVAGVAQGLESVSNETVTMAAASEQLEASVREISRNARTTLEKSEHARGLATSAREAAMGSNARNEEMEKELSATADEVDALEAMLRNIGTVVSDIDAIARQTNLLALNASIEAARAGEHGKGFAVVANEVKELSRTTASRTEQIETRIEEIIGSASKIAEAVRTNTAASKVTRKEASGAVENMMQLDAALGDLTAASKEIADILEQQSVAAREVASSTSTVASNARSLEKSFTEVLCHIEEGTRLAEQSLVNGPGKNHRTSIPLLAKLDHARWMRELADVISHRKDPAQSPGKDHRNCRLGKWYYSQGAELFGGSEVFARLEDPHAALHEMGLAVLEHMSEGRSEVAGLSYTAMTGISQQIQEMLDELTRI